ncbi:hypothetical protein IT396_03150 [Candidatus Nomurabacteria bacterium]|nr:hypothetical protein [Candidatus Nomurabacteria bacterium]
MSLGLRHRYRRKKEKTEKENRLTVWQLSLDTLIYPAAVLAPLALVPQVWHIYATQNASSLSLPTWALLGCLNILWLLYGRAHKETPIVLTNSALMVLNFSMALGILLYS